MEGALRRITASIWGSPTLVGRNLYQATIRSILTYGSEAWFSKIVPKTTISILQRVQNSCLRAILGAYKATLTPILHEEIEILRI
jgi:hypothetical protein